MRYQAIDTLSVAVADVEPAAAAYERLGVRLASFPGGRGRSFTVGPTAARVTTELLADGDVRHPLAEAIRPARQAGRGLFAVALAVDDLSTTLRELAERGIPARSDSWPSAGGLPIPSTWLGIADRAASDLVLIERSGQASPGAEGGHSFPLKRLDHLAAVAHDLEAKTRFWTDVLGVPVAGEVVTPTMIIRQLRIGDAILELLGPASAESPLHQRPPGLVSMAAWEVDDLASAVAQARRVGFMVPDPATGVLPGTRTATIPAAELGGVAMQLLQYV